MDKPAGTLALPATTGFLYDEPFWKPPDADTFGGLTGIVLIVGPKLFIEPGAKAFLRLSSGSDPGL
jgi:hypothetical protein